MKTKETIFTTITRLSNEKNALNLGQGFPNFEPDSNLVDIIKSISSKFVHQYAPMRGNLQLIERISQMTKRFYDRDVSNENILVTAGATQAIFTSITALVDEGDEVIFFDPAYDCYETPILLRNAKPIRINLSFPKYKIPWDDLRSRVNSKTRMIILNNPHNPSGSVMSQDDIRQLESLALDFPQITFLSDEVYEYISWDQHLSLNQSSILKDRSVIVSSFGKTLHLTGWKVGYLIAPENLMDLIVQVHQYNVFSVNSLCQQAIADYIDLNEVNELSQFFNRKKELFLDRIRDSKFAILETGGTYFQLLDYSSISNEKDSQMAIRLIDEFGIASIPVSGFHEDGSDHKVLRFCYGKDDDTLIKAGEILCQI